METVGKRNSKVTIVECAPRDGLGALPKPVPVADKVSLIEMLADAGASKIDCVAFTHPRLLPENADAEDVMLQIKKRPGVIYQGLVPSEVGCRRALFTDIDEVLVLVAASEAFSRAALGLSVREALNKTLPAIIDTFSGSAKPIRGYILAAFGCPYSGKVAFEQISELVLRLAFMGVGEIALVDSTGSAIPGQVTEMVGRLLEMDTGTDLAVHFHNTRGMALANCVAAYEAGIRIFDTAAGGLSGTPYGAPSLDIGFWNVPTEDLVHLLEQMGVATGIKLDRLLKAVEFAEKLAGQPLPGHILRAGPSSDLAKRPKRLRLKTSVK